MDFFVHAFFVDENFRNYFDGISNAFGSTG